MNKYILVLVGAAFISSLSQVMLKISANKIYKSKVAEIINPLVISAYGIFFGVMLINTSILRYVELKYIPIIESTAYIYILILSAAILREKVTRKQVIGNVVIIIGIIVFNM